MIVRREERRQVRFRRQFGRRAGAFETNHFEAGTCQFLREHHSELACGKIRQAPNFIDRLVTWAARDNHTHRMD